MKCIGSIILAACLLTVPETVLGQTGDDVIVPLEPSPRNVRVLATDSSGFLWIGTSHGLFRHERTSLRQFLHDPDDPTTLSHSRILALAVDHEGMIWVGTRNGLNRLDPESWSITRYVHDESKPESIPSESVLALHLDRRNQLWIGMAGGLVKLDRPSGRFVRIERPIDPEGKEHQEAVGSMVDDASGRIWFGSWRGYGVGRFDDSTGEYVHFPVWGPHYVDAVMQAVRERMSDPIAALTHVGNDQDVSRSFSLSQDTRVLVVSGIDKLSVQPHDVGWIEDANRRAVWNANDARCLHGGGAVRNLLCIEELTLEEGSYTLRYTTNGQHAYGDWAGAPPVEQDWWGISLLPAPDPSLRHLLMLERIDSRSIPANPSRLYTVEDSVWIVTDAGVMMYEPESDTLAPNLYGQESGWVELNSEYLFVRDRTSDGRSQLTRIDRKTGSRTSWSSNTKSGFDDVLFASDGAIWLSVDGEGVFVVPPNGPTFRLVDATDTPNPPCNDGVSPRKVAYDLQLGAWQQSVRFDSEVTGSVKTEDGVCWIGTTYGIYRVDGEDVTQYLPDEKNSNSIEGARVTDIIEDSDGYVWVSTVNDDRPGLWGGSINRFHNGELQVFSSGASFGGSIVSDLYEDAEGRLWAAFAGGYGEIIDRGAAFRRFIAQPSLGLRVISESPDGRLWLGDPEGNVFTLDKSTEEIELVAEGRLQEWRSARALQMEADRAMWAAFEGFGLVRYDLATGVQRAFTSADGLASLSFKHLGSRETADGALLFETDDGVIVVSPEAFQAKPTYAPVISDIDTERIETLSFRVLSSAYTITTVLQVRVSDLIEDWRSVVPGERIDLERVPGGAYTIEARELSVAGEGKTVRKETHVREFIWRTAWFRWLLGLLLLGILYGLYLARERHRRQLVEVRRRIARDLHDEVGSQVAGIKLMADLARDPSLSPEARQSEIDEISHTATDLVDALKEVSWFIQSDDEKLNHLVDRMRTYAARHLRGMQLVFQADEEEVTPYLPQRGRREFILIFREAVRNCAQHSGASTVSIELRLDVEDGTLVLEIEDDGVGFEVNGDHNGLGMRAMADRAKILNGSLAVDSTPGIGTRWTLTIPVEVAT